MLRECILGALVVLVGACARTGARQVGGVEPAIVPAAAFARGPALAAAALSPDGRHIATLRTLEGRGAIYIEDADGGNPRLRHRDAARSIGNVRWSGSGRWLWFLQDAGGDEGFHLFRLDPDDASAPRDLTPFDGATVEPVRDAGRGDDRILVAINDRDSAHSDAYRLDLGSGRLDRVAANPGRFIEFVAGAAGDVAAAIAIRPDGTLVVARADDGATRWSDVFEAPPTERFRTLLIDHSTGHLLVLSDRGAPQSRLRALDLASGRLHETGPHPCGDFDVEDVVAVGGRIVGTTCVTERAGVVASDPRLGAAVAAVRREAARSAGVWLEGATPDLGAAILYTDASAQPGRFWLWEPRSGARALGATRPWLEDQPLARTEPRWFTARDGLPLLAYLTRPRGAQGAVPAVVAIHGGPWARDAGGFEAETQFLANRGYAVVQVNFRGSTGLGSATHRAGVGEFGRRMSDDLDDVVEALAAERVLHRNRICLLGGSYGGYAALMGLARGTIPYRCAVDYAGPVDLETLIAAFPPSWAPWLPRSWHRFVGDPRDPAAAARMREVSPLHLVERIRAPVLVFQGANDPRVTQAQSDRLVCALRARALEVDYLLAPDEGHSFANEETRVGVMLATEAFLARHLGGRVDATPEPAALAALDRLRAAARERADCTSVSP